MRRFLITLLAALMAVSLFALPAGADEDPNTTTIVEAVISASGTDIDDGNLRDFDILREAVVAADLVAALDNPDSELTVLAPRDYAFIQTARELTRKGVLDPDVKWWQIRSESQALNALLTIDGGIDTIKSVLLYHVSPEGEFTVRDLFRDRDAGPTLDTLLGVGDVDVRRFTLRDNIGRTVPIAGSSIVVDGGVINPIGRVLVPLVP